MFTTRACTSHGIAQSLSHGLPLGPSKELSCRCNLCGSQGNLSINSIANSVSVTGFKDVQETESGSSVGVLGTLGYIWALSMGARLTPNDINLLPKIFSAGGSPDHHPPSAKVS